MKLYCLAAWLKYHVDNFHAWAWSRRHQTKLRHVRGHIYTVVIK